MARWTDWLQTRIGSEVLSIKTENGIRSAQAVTKNTPIRIRRSAVTKNGTAIRAHRRRDVRSRLCATESRSRPASNSSIDAMSRKITTDAAAKVDAPTKTVLLLINGNGGRSGPRSLLQELVALNHGYQK